MDSRVVDATVLVPLTVVVDDTEGERSNLSYTAGFVEGDGVIWIYEVEAGTRGE